VLSAFVVVEWARERRLPWRLIALTTVMVAVSAPVAIYYRLLTLNDPLWQAILSQYENAGVVTPPWFHLVVLIGLPLLLAPFGVAFLKGEPLSRFVVVWAVVGGVIAYAPTVYQVKLLTAWQFPVAVLAARAWLRWTDRWTMNTAHAPAGRRLRTSAASLVLIGLVVPTNLYLFAWRFVDLGRHERPYFLERDELAALDWLAVHAERMDVVLAPLEVGQFVPSYGRSRAYLAHWAMTNRFFERSRRTKEFFDPTAAIALRRDILDADQVTLVLATSTEPLGTGAETAPVWLQPAFAQGDVRVFKYSPSPLHAGAGHQ
jgi:hypothetical protein